MCVGGGMCIDHVHMSERTPPKLSVAEFMCYLKGKSALMLFDEKPELRMRTVSKDWLCLSATSR